MDFMKALKLGLKLLAIARTYNEAKSDGDISEEEMIVLYNQINRLLRSLGIDLPIRPVPDKVLALSEELGATVSRVDRLTDLLSSELEGVSGEVVDG